MKLIRIEEVGKSMFKRFFSSKETTGFSHKHTYSFIVKNEGRISMMFLNKSQFDEFRTSEYDIMWKRR